jgi:hypothetical protein
MNLDHQQTSKLPISAGTVKYPALHQKNNFSGGSAMREA